MQTETSQSAARFHAVFENAGIGIAIADRSGRLLETNAAVQNMLGYTADELRGKHYADVTHPDDLEREIALSQPLFDGTSSGLQLEKRYIHRDGHVVWGRMTLTVVHESSDQDFAVVMVEDITARKQFENALQRREEELRAVFQSTLDGVAILEPDGVIIDANSAACELLDCPKPELIGRCVKDFLRVPDFENEWRRFRRKGYYRGQFGLGARSRKTVEISAAVMTNDRSVVLLRDLTERQTLEEQLRQSQKMEAIGRFADAIAHDFNNILTIILGYAEFLRDEAGGESAMLPAITNLIGAANRGSALVNELLFFSKGRSSRTSVSDLNRIVEGFSPLLSRLLGPRIKLDTSLGSEHLDVAVERIRLEQVLLNLAANARDAIQGNGTLSIESTALELASSYAEGFGDAAAGRYALLRVRDDGMGMDEETRSKIFEPFFTTKHAKQGTGLGLATVYSIVKQSGGYVWADSSPGNGATFTLLFPLVQGKNGRS